jgi:hypothetical protein
MIWVWNIVFFPVVLCCFVTTDGIEEMRKRDRGNSMSKYTAPKEDPQIIGPL